MSSFQKIKELTQKVLGEGGGDPVDFVALLQALFSLTVLTDGEGIHYRLANNRTSGVIGGRSRLPLKLNNGKFLKFFMDVKTVRKAPLTVTKSSFQYQIDDVSHSDQFVFRYDYNINHDNQHPIAHLQISGDLRQKNIIDKELEDIRFPVVRPSVESLVTLLIDGFGLKPNDDSWRKALKYSEDALHHYRAKQLVQSKA